MNNSKDSVTSNSRRRIIDVEFEEMDRGPLRFFGYMLYMAACGAGLAVTAFGLVFWLLISIDVEPESDGIPCTMIESEPADSWVREKPCNHNL